MISEQRLWMTSLPILEDKFEAKTPDIISDQLHRALSEAKTEAEQKIIHGNIRLICCFAEKFYPNYFVSCWSMNDVESNLMWEAYGKPPKAIAIQTTFDRLVQSLPKCLDIGLVRYMDYRKTGFERMNMYEWPMHKREQFRDEREVRVLADLNVPDELGGSELKANLFEGGVELSRVRMCAPPIDAFGMIESIYLHPRSDQLFADTVIKFCRENKLPVPQRSEMANSGSFHPARQ